MDAKGSVKIDLDDLELEIEPKDSTSESSERKHPLVRRSFRVPVDQENRIRAHLRGREFTVSNVSENGLQILLRMEDHLRAEQTIDSVVIFFGETAFYVKGRVAYVDQIDWGQFALGLELMFNNQEQREAFRDYQKELRNGYLRKRDDT